MVQLHIFPPLTNTKIEDPSAIFSHPLTHKTFMSLCMYHKCGKAANSESIHEDQKGSYYIEYCKVEDVIQEEQQALHRG